MKLEPSYMEDHPDVLSTTEYNYNSMIVALGAGGAFFALFVGIVVILLQRQKSAASNRHMTLLVKRSPEKPLTLKKPTAVRSPGQVVGAGVILKKTPSPTGSKSPPGGSASLTGISADARRKSCDSSDHSHRSSIDSSKKNSPDVEAATEAVEQGDDTAMLPGYKETGSHCVSEKAISSRMSIDMAGEADAKLGKLHFRLKYNYGTKALCVTIEKCSDLVGKDGGHCDPYVKLHLMPEKQHKVKTRVLMRTRNPIYDEEFTFFGVDPSQLKLASLNFVVLSFDRFSRDKVIGEVSVELAHTEFDTLEKQISLIRDICPRDLKIRKEGRGELLVSLCYQPAANRLTVVVLKARNLPKMDFAGLCDPYVKIYLLCDGQRIAKKKTHIKKRTLNPVFNESFVFDVPYQEGLGKISLEFMLLDYERVTKNEVIGKLVLDMNAGGEAQKHWEEVASKPRRQIAEWHKLQLSGVERGEGRGSVIVNHTDAKKENFTF